MDKQHFFEGTPDPRNASLAQWLQELLAQPPQPPRPERTSIVETSGALKEEYHPRFYTQLPDFAAALLANDPDVMVRYAPLLYHLLGCRACHSAYLEIYDALWAARASGDTSPFPDIGQHKLAATPSRMLVYLCQLLISQARAVLVQSRHEHTDNDELARSLLRQAMQMSAHIMQGTQRQRALRDLVEVAVLAQGASAGQQDAQAQSYSAQVVDAAGSRRGKVLRRADMLERPAEDVFLELQSGALKGRIVQRGEMLELLLDGLNASWRGHHVLVRVPLGSLLEPVRWLGGNPWAIRSQSPVDEHGSLKTPIGYTDLHLSDPEDYNLLEAMFKKLDLRPAE